MSVSYSKLMASLGDATASIQGRSDYTSTKIDVSGTEKSLTQLVSDYNSLKQTCATASSGGTAPSDSALAGASADTEALTNANIAQINMGQLSTDRTITPTAAKAQNEILATLSTNLMEVRAQLSGGGGGDAASGWITGIDIEGMTALSATAVSVPYEKGGKAAVSVEIQPPSKAAEESVTWTGVSGTPPTFSTGQITPSDKPASIAATLGDQTATMQVYVVPVLQGLKVAGAKATKEEDVYDASKAKQVTVTATTEPHTADAWAYLHWSGGAPATGSKPPLNERVVDVAASAGEVQIPVTAWIAVPPPAPAKDKEGKS